MADQLALITKTRRHKGDKGNLKFTIFFSQESLAWSF